MDGNVPAPLQWGYQPNLVPHLAEFLVVRPDHLLIVAATVEGTIDRPAA
jgi:hypothetical protein